MREYEYGKKNDDIDLIDLWWKVVYGWRFVIICTVIFAIFLPGVKYVKDSRSNVNTDSALSAEELRQNLTDKEQIQLEKAEKENAAIEKQLALSREYQEESILMNIDPYAESQVIMQYYVNTHRIINYTQDMEQDYTEELIAAYCTYATNDYIIEENAKALGLQDRKYLEELVNVHMGTSSDVNIQSNIFSITVAGRNMDEAKAVAEIIQKSVESYHDELNSKIGNHDLTLIGNFESIVQDNDLAIKQAQLETTIATLRTQQTTLKTELSEEQLNILETVEMEQESPADDTGKEPENNVKVGISKKYIVLGGFVGIFLSCLWIAFRYIVGARVKNTRELQEGYGLRLLGNLDMQNKKRKPLAFVDAWLKKCRYREKWTLEEQLELATTNLIVTCKKFQMEKVFFTTSLHLNEEEKQPILQIMKSMQEQGIEAVFGENIIRNTKAFVQMSEIGQVVLVEKIENTEYKALEKELTLCKEQKAEVIGVIALEA